MTDQQAIGSKPRFYTEGYKRQVVDLVASSGRTATAVAAEVGLHPTLLCRWVRQYGASGGKVEAARPAISSVSKLLRVPTADQAAEPDAEHLPGSRGCGASAAGCAWSGTF